MAAIRHIAAVALAAVLAAEAGLRLLRATDFPLYDANDRIGYIPRAGQHGSLLWSRDFAFNGLHMATAAPFAPSPTATDVVLVGDSIVFGGNPYRAEERLGPQLAAATGLPVWPVAAGSWSLHNELAYFQRFPTVAAAADRIVFVLNSGDFDRPSSWASEATHPRRAPASALGYWLEKTLFTTATAIAPPAGLAVAPFDWRPAFTAFMRSTAADVCVLLYPDAGEVERGYTPVLDRAAGELAAAAGRPLAIVSLAADPRWTAAAYRDAIHPHAAGNGILAAIIVERCGLGRRG